MYIYDYDAENIDFLNSMEVRRKWLRKLLYVAAMMLGLLMLVVPEAEAKTRLSKAERAQLVDEITMQVADALPYQGARLQAIETLTVRGKLPAMWRLELIVPSSWRTTRVQAKIFDVEDAARPAAFVQASLSVEIPVYQVISRIDAGEELDPSSFEQTYVSLYKAPHDAITSIEELQDKVTRRALEVGKVIGQSVLDDPVIYKRGDIVKIRVRRGNVVLVDSGQALETGKLNQTMRVKSTSTDAVLSGIVKRDGVVF